MRRVPVLVGVLLVLAAGGASLGDSASPSLSAGGLQTCAVAAGAAACWGDNAWGELGDGTQSNRPFAGPVSRLGSGVQAVAAGLHHTCAVVDGGARCWGWNVNGQLGDGTYDDRSRPVPVVGLHAGVQALAAAGGHTCALLVTRAVQCWGDNFLGELGNGTRDTSKTPVAVSGLDSGVQAIGAGGDVDEHTCALLTSGGVECWGSDEVGQLGIGSDLDFRTTPVPVTGLSGGVRSIAVGGTLQGGHTCALLDTGRVECWGWNRFGQLGDGTTTKHLTPTPVTGLTGVRAIAAGDGHTCALLDDATVDCWGWNDAGQLGDGTTTNRRTPVAVRGLRNVVAISAGNGDTCAELRSGSVKCWGLNIYGQLGDGSRTDRSHAAGVLGLKHGAAVLIVHVKGRGAVTGRGVRCASQCGYERPRRTRLILTARPSNGWAFKAWYGACKGHSSRCTARFSADSTIVAAFVKRS